MEDLTDSSAFTSPVRTPSDGDACNRDDHAEPHQALANRTAYLRNHTLFANAGAFNTIPFHDMRVGNEGGNWIWTGGPAAGTPWMWLQSDVSAQTSITLELGLGMVIAGTPITSVRAYLIGSIGAAHGGVPATKPRLYFQEYDYPNGVGAGQVSYSVDAIDSSGTVGAYDAQHLIDLTVSRTLNAQKRYAIIFRGEAGANAANNKLALIGLSLSWGTPT